MLRRFGKVMHLAWQLSLVVWVGAWLEIGFMSTSEWASVGVGLKCRRQLNYDAMLVGVCDGEAMAHWHVGEDDIDWSLPMAGRGGMS